MQISMRFFMGVMFIVGLVLSIFAVQIDKKVQTCMDQNVQNSARGLLVMGVAILSIAGTYLLAGGGKAGAASNSSGMVFILLMLALGITVMTMSSIVHKGCSAARSLTPVLITMSTLSTAIAGAYLIYHAYKSMSGQGKANLSYRFG